MKRGRSKILIGVLLGAMILIVILVPTLGLTIAPLSPSDGITTDNDSIEISFNFTVDSLNNLTLAWYETNYTFYDDSILMFLPFENRSELGENDTRIIDISQYNQPSIDVLGGATWNPLTGHNSGAFMFNGSQYIDTNFNPSITEGDLSFSAWVIFYNNNSQRYSDAFARNYEYRVFLDQNDMRLRIVGRNAAGSYVPKITPTDDTISYNQWYHLAFVYDSETNRSVGYFNGDLFENDTHVGLYNTSTELWIGRGSGSNFYMNGSVDNLIISNRSWSTEEVQQIYRSQLIKYNSTNWGFSSNQSLNYSSQLLNSSNPTYNNYYYLCISNSSLYESCSPQRTIVQTIPDKNVGSNFSNSVGVIKNYIYGVNDNQRSGSNLSFIDTDKNSVLDTQSNDQWHINSLIEAGINFIRLSMFLDHTSLSEGVFNTTGQSDNRENINSVKNLVSVAKENNFKILLATNGMPTWLANTTEGWCTTYVYTCPPSNYTKWGELVVDFLQTVDCDADTCEIEVWNEPDLTQFWMSDVATSNGVRSVEYNKLYNATYLAVKTAYPGMAVGGPGLAEWGTGSQVIFPNLLGNFSDQMDFVSFHEYKRSTEENFYDLLDSGFEGIVANCTATSANCSRMFLDEYNVWDSNVKVNLSDEWATEIALAYAASLGSYPENLSLAFYQWSANSKYVSGDFFEMVSEPQLDNEFYIAYNVTKNFASLCPVGGTVYLSSNEQDSTLKLLSCKSGTNYAVIVINAGTGSRDVDLDLSGEYPYTTISNYETGSSIDLSSGIANLGVLDRYEYLYLIGSETPSNIVNPGGNGGSGGGRVAYPTYYPTQSELEQGYEKTLRKHWKIQFKFENENHTLALEDLTSQIATINVSSDSVIFNLTEDQTKNLDVNDDGFYDLEVYLTNITDTIVYEANLMLKLMSGEIPVEENPEEGLTGDIVTKSKLWIWILIIFCLVLGIIVVMVRVMGKKGKL